MSTIVQAIEREVVDNYTRCAYKDYRNKVKFLKSGMIVIKMHCTTSQIHYALSDDTINLTELFGLNDKADIDRVTNLFRVVDSI